MMKVNQCALMGTRGRRSGSVSRLIPGLLPALGLAAMLVQGASAFAASVPEDVRSLAGTWQGDAHDGAKVTFSAVDGHEDILATGSLKIEGGPLAGQTDYALLHLSNQYFLVPAASPFAAGTTSYSLTHLPAGGLKFTRLVHVDGQDSGGPGVQMEEIEIGKLKSDGTRTMLVMRGERLCKDAASPAGKSCGAAVSEHFVIRKAAQ